MKAIRIEINIDEMKGIIHNALSINWSLYPEDTRIMRVAYDKEKKMYYLIITSSKFKDILTNDYQSKDIPVQTPTFSPVIPAHVQYKMMLTVVFPILLSDYLGSAQELLKKNENEQCKILNDLYGIRISEYMNMITDMEVSNTDDQRA